MTRRKPPCSGGAVPPGLGECTGGNRQREIPGSGGTDQRDHPLVAAIQERLPKVKVGPGNDPESEMGPLVTREHRDKVAGYLDAAREQGARVVTDGREDAAFGGDGFFLGV